MSTTHHHAHTHNVDQRRADPTGTMTIRERRFVPDLRARFRRIRGLIRATVGYENDALGLTANAEPAEVFDFPTDAAKEAAFVDWLETAMDDEVLEPVGMIALRDGRHYTGTYVRSSYTRALADADRRLREAGVDVADADVATVINAPIHERTLQRLYTRTFENLEGITDDTARILREELTRGLAEGVNPRTVARRLTGEIRTISRTRAEVLARTETINAYTESTLTRFEQVGVGRVTVSAEWQTAGDQRVCPICETLEGQTFTVREARTETFEFDASAEDVIDSLAGEYPVKPPTHVQCRCALLPAAG